MVSLARKNLLHDRLRFAITVAGVAFAVTLVLVQVGLFMGLLAKATVTIEHATADIWVTSKNTPNVGLRPHVPGDGGPARPGRARRGARGPPSPGRCQAGTNVAVFLEVSPDVTAACSMVTVALARSHEEADDPRASVTAKATPATVIAKRSRS